MHGDVRRDPQTAGRATNPMQRRDGMYRVLLPTTLCGSRPPLRSEDRPDVHGAACGAGTPQRHLVRGKGEYCGGSTPHHTSGGHRMAKEVHS